MVDQRVGILSEKGQANLADFLKSVELYIDLAGLLGVPEEIGESGFRGP